mmetsp:Transcript_16917/g.25086  ORF Transcript_16917/g.25086 Transcript_16917/m.25086 type:complete len:285 (-) Transcript_16917:177-1031(-)|eukprot:CAMPEP_0194068750 /NCGR_PEP_ID=MMETSP0009_2-20130614/87265_1 /TAXON_ID=210454 /ORGANISM="Grammatophora oceanica, Strain CCMP 410" /LENGTH=284 /DNA_ID=CAMNT_0038721875 /DNA_START=43 /DNA_END=897 /DNA_ORIENTATION=+
MGSSTATTSASESKKDENQSGAVSASPLPLSMNHTNNARLSNTVACLPLVYGSVAFYLAKKADDYATHEWTLYLRGPNNEDLSGAISKVIFHLHPSFAQPTRELTAPPFQVTERGWGEFEAQIRIQWKDPAEKAIVLMHVIKLYPPGSNNNTPPTTEPVVSEVYDEVVFTDPKESFLHQLKSIRDLPKVTATSPELQKCFLEYTDEEEAQKLLEAQAFLTAQLSKVKDKFEVLSREMAEVDQALLDVQTKRQQQPPPHQASVQRHQQQASKKSSEPSNKRSKIG